MEASQVKKYDMSSTFKGEFSLRDILAGMERQEFFTYQGMYAFNAKKYAIMVFSHRLAYHTTMF